METVTLFGEEVVLDKELYIFLDMAAITEAEIDKFEPRDQIWVTVLDTEAAINKGINKILTTCTHFLSAKYMEKGYNIIVLRGQQRISMADLLNNPEGREIRPAHNWEKMLYAGCFDIDISF